MAQVQPPLRVSPSGPLADANGELSPPLSQVAGNSFKLDVSPPFSDATIDQANVTGTNPMVLYTPGTVPTGNRIPMAATYTGPEGLVEYGLGIWLVEANIGVSFASTPPAAAGDMGGLSVSAVVYNDDGTVSSGAALSAASPLPVDPNGTAGGYTTHSGQYVGFFEVTPAMIAANGGEPLKQVSVSLTRISLASIGQTYGNASGRLHISRDTNLVVRRFR